MSKLKNSLQNDYNSIRVENILIKRLEKFEKCGKQLEQKFSKLPIFLYHIQKNFDI